MYFMLKMSLHLQIYTIKMRMNWCLEVSQVRILVTAPKK